MLDRNSQPTDLRLNVLLLGQLVHSASSGVPRKSVIHQGKKKDGVRLTWLSCAYGCQTQKHHQSVHTVCCESGIISAYTSIIGQFSLLICAHSKTIQ